MKEYIAIGAGLLIGTLAHFGRMIHDNVWPTFNQVLGFLMQLGAVALVAAVISEGIEMQSDLLKSLMTAALTLAVNEVIAMLRRKGATLAEQAIKD